MESDDKFVMTASIEYDASQNEIDGQTTELLCEPCLDDGKRLAADGFCEDCSDYLCQECFQNHCVPRPMKNHKLLDKHDMPKEPTKVNKYKDECTDRCTIHGEELMKFYCEDHEQFGCTVCITLEHRTCKVGYIPTISADIIESDEYKAFKADIETLIKQAESVTMTANENNRASKRLADTSLGKVRELRGKINNIFDKLEKKIVDEISQIRTEDQTKMTEILGRCGTISDKLHKLQSDITNTESKSQTCKLFVETKRNKNEIENFRNDLSNLCSKNKIRKNAFIPSQEMPNSLNNFSLGSVDSISYRPTRRQLPDVLKGEIHSITLVSGNIAVLYQSKCKTHDRTELELVDGRFGNILVSHNVRSVKLSPFSVQYQQHGEYESYGMTTISDDKIAIRCGRCINIYYITDDTIKSELEIRSTGLSDTPIAFVDDTFIAVTSTSPPAVCLVNMNGQITRTFPSEDRKTRKPFSIQDYWMYRESTRTFHTNVYGKVLFNSPSSIAVHPDHTTMYVLDSGMKTVTCLRFDGKVKAQYKPAHTRKLCDLVVSRDGLVYVSDSSTNNIYILSPELEQISVIHGDQHDIYYPRHMAYCGKEHKLYVVSGEGDIVILDLEPVPIQRS